MGASKIFLMRGISTNSGLLWLTKTHVFAYFFSAPQKGNILHETTIPNDNGKKEVSATFAVGQDLHEIIHSFLRFVERKTRANLLKIWFK